LEQAEEHQPRNVFSAAVTHLGASYASQMIPVSIEMQRHGRVYFGPIASTSGRCPWLQAICPELRFVCVFGPWEQSKLRTVLAHMA